MAVTRGVSIFNKMPGGKLMEANVLTIYNIVQTFLWRISDVNSQCHPVKFNDLHVDIVGIFLIIQGGNWQDIKSLDNEWYNLLLGANNVNSFVRKYEDVMLKMYILLVLLVII